MVPTRYKTMNRLHVKLFVKKYIDFFNSWFRASQFNVNKSPTSCNSMQIFIHCKVTLHVSGVTSPIIRSTKNSNRKLRYRSGTATSLQRGPEVAVTVFSTPDDG